MGKVIKNRPDCKSSTNLNKLKHNFDVCCFKLKILFKISQLIQMTLFKLCKQFCEAKIINKIVFTCLKIENYISFRVFGMKISTY